ncbi:GWxTD domain-containing protein [Gemmatimonadota bacterium]
MRLTNLTACLLFSCFLMVGCAFSEPALPGPPGLTGFRADSIDPEVSLALFRSPDQQGYLLHVHVSFPQSSLFFLRRQSESGTVWRASYEWRVIIRERNAFQHGGGVYIEGLDLPGEESVSDPSRRIRLFRQFPLPAGEYRVEVIVSDRQSIRSGNRQREITAGQYAGGTPALSQIELLDPGSEGFERPVTEVGAAHAAEVMASRRNPEDAPLVAFLYETYNLPEGASVACRLISEAGNEALNRRRSLPAGSMTVRDTIDIEGLEEGRYSLQLQLEGVADQPVTESLLIRIHRPLLAGGDDPETAETQLTLFADEEAVRTFRGLPIGARTGFLDSLWNTLDPTPGTPRNEARDEFIRRLRYADEQWRLGTRRGWEVDIGRVYIAFGEPDEIVEERQTRTSVRPFEEARQIVFSKWIYRDSAVTFVFVHEPERGWVLDRERSNMIPPERAVRFRLP